VKDESETVRVSSYRYTERDFVDALRESLGLDPLYRSKEPSRYGRTYRDVGEFQTGCRRGNGGVSSW
jgi:hypothetical protein